eukprot:gene3947-2810_t
MVTLIPYTTNTVLHSISFRNQPNHNQSKEMYLLSTTTIPRRNIKFDEALAGPSPSIRRHVTRSQTLASLNQDTFVSIRIRKNAVLVSSYLRGSCARYKGMAPRPSTLLSTTTIPRRNIKFDEALAGPSPSIRRHVTRSQTLASLNQDTFVSIRIRKNAVLVSSYLRGSCARYKGMAPRPSTLLSTTTIPRRNIKFDEALAGPSPSIRRHVTRSQTLASLNQDTFVSIRIRKNAVLVSSYLRGSCARYKGMAPRPSTLLSTTTIPRRNIKFDEALAGPSPSIRRHVTRSQTLASLNQDTFVSIRIRKNAVLVSSYLRGSCARYKGMAPRPSTVLISQLFDTHLQYE